MTNNSEVASEDDERFAPSHIAHFVIRTNKYTEMLAWYRKVFEPVTVFTNDLITFLTFDDEHHRLAIINFPTLADSSAAIAAIDHVAFSFGSLEKLLGNYERIKKAGIVPVAALNHGPTTSLYYADPNGNKIELQVDNFEEPGRAAAFFRTEQFAANVVGVEFDPDVLVMKLRNGTSVVELLKQGSAPRGSRA